MWSGSLHRRPLILLNHRGLSAIEAIRYGTSSAHGHSRRPPVYLRNRDGGTTNESPQANRRIRAGGWTRPGWPNRHDVGAIEGGRAGDYAGLRRGAHRGDAERLWHREIDGRAHTDAQYRKARHGVPCRRQYGGRGARRGSAVRLAGGKLPITNLIRSGDVARVEYRELHGAMRVSEIRLSGKKQFASR